MVKITIKDTDPEKLPTFGRETFDPSIREQILSMPSGTAKTLKGPDKETTVKLYRHLRWYLEGNKDFSLHIKKGTIYVTRK